MLTKVEIDNLQGSVLSLPLQDISAGYVVKGIDGIDPVKATISSTAFAQLDGTTPGGARRDNRNIILNVGFEPDFSLGNTVKVLRKNLYTYLMPKTNVNLKFYDDDVLYATILGQVESCEAPPFSQDPEANVSIICFDPAFVAPTPTAIAGNTVTTSTEQTVTYAGSVEVGYIFTLNVNRSMTGFTLYNRRPNGDITSIDVTYALLSGDVVSISTQQKNKYIFLTRAGVTTSILYAVGSTAKWAPLYPGANYIRALATGAAVPFTISYLEKYGGL